MFAPVSSSFNTDPPGDAFRGEFLKQYEMERYTLVDRAMLPIETIYRIFVPNDAEQFPDVSFYQGDIDWAVMATHTRAAILRIGQGVWEDTKFKRNYSEARLHDVILGGYWFYDGRYSPRYQFEKLMSIISGCWFEMEIVVDWEVMYGGAYDALEHVVAFMQLLDGAGIKCKAIGMYTGFYFFIEHSSPVTHASQYAYLKTKPLHIAWYAAASLVKVPPPWADQDPNFRTHQWGTPVVYMGQQTKEIDMNSSFLPMSDFMEFYGASGPVDPPPPSGGFMYKVISNTHSLSIRPLHQVVGSSTILSIPIGVEVQADEIWQAPDVVYNSDGLLLNQKGDVWAHVDYSGTVGWVGLIHMGKTYGTYVEVTPPPPPAGGGFPASMNVQFDYPDPVTGQTVVVYKGKVDRQ